MYKVMSHADWEIMVIENEQDLRTLRRPKTAIYCFLYINVRLMLNILVN